MIIFAKKFDSVSKVNEKKVILNDRAIHFAMYNSLCAYCKHLNEGRYTCVAFPESIPDNLLSAEERHDKPINGQSGNTVFELKEEYKDGKFNGLLTHLGINL
jgi:hypothetical protein